MKYFIDTEFHERTILGIDTIELISIAIVREDGEYLYEVSNEFNLVEATKNNWLFNNVLKHLPDVNEWIMEEDIRIKILEFIPPESNPTFYGYYADYDWVVFCWLFGRMIDLPDGYPMYCRDLKQMFDESFPEEDRDEVKKHHTYPKQTDEHNALADARWNLELYNFIKKWG